MGSQATIDDGPSSVPDEQVECLQARLRVEPQPNVGCSAVHGLSNGTKIKQQLVRCDAASTEECRMEVATGNGQQWYLKESVQPECICPVFSRHDCIAAIETVDISGLVVSITVPNRAELREIVDSLRKIGATSRLLQIKSPAHNECSSVDVQIDSLTEKQREAVRVAVISGYYDSPRNADLNDLAEHLGITRSAVSQRLAAVEKKLITALHETNGSPPPTLE